MSYRHAALAHRSRVYGTFGAIGHIVVVAHSWSSDPEPSKVPTTSAVTLAAVPRWRLNDRWTKIPENIASTNQRTATSMIGVIGITAMKVSSGSGLEILPSTLSTAERSARVQLVKPFLPHILLLRLTASSANGECGQNVARLAADGTRNFVAFFVMLPKEE